MFKLAVIDGVGAASYCITEFMVFCFIGQWLQNTVLLMIKNQSFNTFFTICLKWKYSHGYVQFKKVYLRISFCVEFFWNSSYCLNPIHWILHRDLNLNRKCRHKQFSIIAGDRKRWFYTHVFVERFELIRHNPHSPNPCNFQIMSRTFLWVTWDIFINFKKTTRIFAWIDVDICDC